MKVTLIVLSMLFLIMIVSLFIHGINSRKGSAPGLIDGKLSQCSKKPNCVCSEVKGDAEHYIKPLLISSGDDIENLSIAKVVLKEMGGVLKLEDKNYILFNFTSAIFGFVDDMEIHLNKNTIHFRSASRVGTSDFGVNRKRVNEFKKIYQESSKYYQKM